MATNSSAAVLRLHAGDHVGVAIRPLEAGDPVEVDAIRVSAGRRIPAGHKVALASVPRGHAVRKYGQQIGVATVPIQPGDWVHTHNLENADSPLDYAPCRELPPPPEPIAGRTFQGYRRADGRAGTRNYIAVISSVNCSASVSKAIAARFPAEALQGYEQIDGVVAFTHDTGCGMPYRGLAHEMLNRVLGGLARHPNIGGFLLIGLGCEQAAPAILVEQQRLVQIGGPGGETSAVPVLSLQDLGGTQRTLEAAVRLIEQMLPGVNDRRREPVPASQLVLGLECGGSDGNSGITANPAVGFASDLLVACGGTAILGETPEICGAEHLLTRRAVTPEVAEKLIERVRWWKWYAGLFGAELDNNPSPGNKDGGLTTISEKSLGAVAKAGSTALQDVVPYAENVPAGGLVFMDTPGYDPASVTGMVAGGANLVVFTTGRGSCFGCKPTPSLKIATNTAMFERMRGDMDLDAGEILAGRAVREVGAEIFERLLAVASGEKTKSELHGIGDEEFVPWTVGPML